MVRAWEQGPAVRRDLLAGTVPPMPGLTEALGFSSLIAGTLEYAILLRHREVRRRETADAELASDLGHEALVRMSLLGRATPRRRWSAFGTRFR